MEYAPISPVARRLFEARRKQQKRVESLNPVLQPTLDVVVHKAEMKRYDWKGLPKLGEFDDDEVLLAEPPLPLELVDDAQVSFLVLKKCLRCKRLNAYESIACRFCRGRFVFDKTVRF